MNGNRHRDPARRAKMSAAHHREEPTRRLLAACLPDYAAEMVLDSFKRQVRMELELLTLVGERVDL